MTVVETHVRVPDVHGDPAGFDPLAEFYGQWNTRLAERYWTLLTSLFGKWECIGGRLVGAPTESSGNSYGEGGLIAMLRGPARAAGFVVYGSLNLSFEQRTASVAQLKLVTGEYKTISEAVTGEQFTMTEPFEAAFDVNELLEP